MFSMRLKLSTTGNQEWICWFCVHVRTATIVFGIYHLILHILGLAVLALVMRNYTYLLQKQQFEESDFLPTPLSKVKDEDNPYYLPTTQDGKPILPAEMDMGAIMTICTLSITLLMVYGALKGKPKQVLPFFFFQLFDFAITTLTATGYFCYIRSVHRLVADHWHNLPFRQDLLAMSPQNLSLLVLLFFMSAMIWKAYWIGVVWRCYKYLTLKQQATHNIHFILPNGNDGNERLNDPSSDYAAMFRDEAGAYGPMKQTPPPSYQDVMDEQPPPYPATTIATVVQEISPNRRVLINNPNGTVLQEVETEPELEDDEAAKIVQSTAAQIRQESTPISPSASCSSAVTVTSPKEEENKDLKSSSMEIINKIESTTNNNNNEPLIKPIIIIKADEEL